MTNSDRNLRLAAFTLNIISMVALGWTLLPLAWMSPMTVMSWGIYKGTRANTVAFGVCNLLFVNTIGGGLLISNKEWWPIPRNFRRVAFFVPFVQAVG